MAIEANGARPASEIIIREARAADEWGLRRLAELDSATVLKGPALVAEERGELRAAIELANCRVIANPFAPTAAIVELLRLRCGHIPNTNAKPGSTRWPWPAHRRPRRTRPAGSARRMPAASATSSMVAKRHVGS